MQSINHIKIVCPANTLTAGPEALHQLGADLNRLGFHASIVYYPFDAQHSTPESYLKYEVPVSKYEDKKDDLIVFPEIYPFLTNKVKNADVAIWWMSVNNFTGERLSSPWRNKIRYLKYCIKGIRPFGGVETLKHYRHFAQSQFAYEFLQNHHISAQMLSDPIPYYTTTNYLNNLQSNVLGAHRANRILYNPKKGMSVVSPLMKKYPKLEFVPLVGFNRDQLAELCLNSKLYIDFGHHPGKDRLPREAALHGSAVITGQVGSAKNAIDIPIPSKYKLEATSPSFEEDFYRVAQYIFDDFDKVFEEFNPYRQIIANEQITFDQQILEAFTKYRS